MSYHTELFPFESRWVDIGQHSIHYVDEGKGPVILFSHAALGSSFMFRKFIEILSPFYRCIALDYLGFGLSSDVPSQNYSILTQSYILQEFIHRLNLTDIIGLGHDTGGPSLFRVAAEHPNLFQGLILTDTLIFPSYTYERIHRMLSLVGSGLFQWVNAQTNFLAKATFSRGITTRKLSQEEKRQYEQLFSTPHKRRRITQLLYSLREESKMMEELSQAFKKHLKDKPSLLIYGEKDPLTQLGIPQRIHEMLSKSELLFVEKEGHFPHEGQPEFMANSIHQWIQALKLESLKKP